MDNWKGTLLQVIGILLGSSVVLGFINNFISTLNQPDIKISVTYDDMSGFNDDMTLDYVDVIYLTEIRNLGNSPATNLQLFINFPRITPSNTYSHVESTENFTDKDLEIINKTLITGKLEKLGRGGEILINLTFRMDENYYNSLLYSSDSDFNPYQPGCKVTLSYDQNTSIYNCIIQSSIYKLEYPLLLLLGLSAIIIYLYQLKRFRTYKHNKKKFDFITLIQDDIYKVYNIFNKDLQSSQIFSSDLWDSIPQDEKRKIFNNYKDYKKINEFYLTIRNRDNSFSYDVDNETLRVYNSIILKLSTELLTINWDNYYINEVIVGKSIPIILIILLFSISFSIVEILIVSIIDNFIFKFFILITYSTIILYLIFKHIHIQYELPNPIFYKKPNTRLRPLLFYKIFPLSAAILGFPIETIVFIISPLAYSNLTYDVVSFPPSYPYLITFSIIIANIGRVYLIFKILMKSKREIKHKFKIFSEINILSGSLYITSALILLFLNEGNLFTSSTMIFSIIGFSILIVYFSFGVLDIILGILFRHNRFASHKVGIITSSFVIIMWFAMLGQLQIHYYLYDIKYFVFVIIGIAIVILRIYYIKNIRLNFSVENVEAQLDK